MASLHFRAIFAVQEHFIFRAAFRQIATRSRLSDRFTAAKAPLASNS